MKTDLLRWFLFQKFWNWSSFRIPLLIYFILNFFFFFWFLQALSKVSHRRLCSHAIPTKIALRLADRCTADPGSSKRVQFCEVLGIFFISPGSCPNSTVSFWIVPTFPSFVWHITKMQFTVSKLSKLSRGKQHKRVQVHSWLSYQYQSPQESLNYSIFLLRRTITITSMKHFLQKHFWLNLMFTLNSPRTNISQE